MTVANAALAIRVVAVCGLLWSTGAIAAKDVTIEIDPATILAPPTDAAAINVEMTDRRLDSTLERTTIGKLSLGDITLVPPETELVEALVAAQAAREGIDAGRTLFADVREFTITTPATALYWDVVTTIEVVVRLGDRQQTVTGSGKARTWVYPTKKVIERVTRDALSELAKALAPALAALKEPAAGASGGAMPAR